MRQCRDTTANDTGDKSSSSSPVPLQVLCTLFAEYFASFDRSTCAPPVSCHVAFPCPRYTGQLGLQFQTALHEGAAEPSTRRVLARGWDRPFTFPWASFQITFSCSGRETTTLTLGSELPITGQAIIGGKSRLPKRDLTATRTTKTRCNPTLCCHRESNPILPVHSPLLRQSSFLAFPLLTDMLKFGRSFATPSG